MINIGEVELNANYNVCTAYGRYLQNKLFQMVSLRSLEWLIVLTLVRNGRLMMKKSFPLIDICKLFICESNSFLARCNWRSSHAQNVSFSIYLIIPISCKKFMAFSWIVVRYLTLHSLYIPEPNRSGMR